MRLLTLLIASFFIGSMALPSMAQDISADDLCPDPRELSKRSPSDLADIQSDIERFELCVQRAELLKSLNEAALRNQELLEASASKNVSNLPMNASPSPATPQPSAPSLGVDVSNFGSDSSLPSLEEPEESKPSAPWTIEKIYGVSGRLLAVITDSSGETITVRRADVTPDGYTVMEITKSGILLNQGNETLGLRWTQ